MALPRRACSTTNTFTKVPVRKSAALNGYQRLGVAHARRRASNTLVLTTSCAQPTSGERLEPFPNPFLETRGEEFNLRGRMKSTEMAASLLMSLPVRLLECQ